MTGNFQIYIDRLGTAGSYAGIGSRRLSELNSFFLFKAAFVLALSGYRNNSGHADGSDMSTEVGAIEALRFLLGLSNDNDVSLYLNRIIEISLPWEGFNGGRSSPGYNSFRTEEAALIASKFHPVFSRLDRKSKMLMSRNSNQILGRNLTPEEHVKFVMCYTSDQAYKSSMCSSKSGGTGQAIRLADTYGKPIFNISFPEHYSRIESYINKFCSDFFIKHSIDLLNVIETSYREYKGVRNYSEGSFIDRVMSGNYDVVVHDMNCFNAATSDLSKALFEHFPQLKEADSLTKKGDRSKLGFYSKTTVNINGKSVVLVNAYTQFNASDHSDSLHCDYKAIKNILYNLSSEFSDRNLLISKIGVGQGNGCWITISNIIENNSSNFSNVAVVNFDRSEYVNKYVSPNKLIKKDYSFEDFEFFHGSECILSQWHPSKFIENGLVFAHCEQYMMYQKAMLFNDSFNAKRIMSTKSPGGCKQLGWEVKQFKEEIWVKHRENIIFKGNFLKFTQNPLMLDYLLRLNDKIIVEASRTDKIYGVGMDVRHKDITNPQAWVGLNLLGKAHHRVRNFIISNYQSLGLDESCMLVINNYLAEQGGVALNENSTQMALI